MRIAVIGMGNVGGILGQRWAEASWPSLRTDLRNAGAEWMAEEDNLVTSLQPDDIPAFHREMITLFARHPVPA